MFLNKLFFLLKIIVREVYVWRGDGGSLGNCNRQTRADDDKAFMKFHILVDHFASHLFFSSHVHLMVEWLWSLALTRYGDAIDSDFDEYIFSF